MMLSQSGFMEIFFFPLCVKTVVVYLDSIISNSVKSHKTLQTEASVGINQRVH